MAVAVVVVVMLFMFLHKDQQTTAHWIYQKLVSLCAICFSVCVFRHHALPPFDFIDLFPSVRMHGHRR